MVVTTCCDRLGVSWLIFIDRLIAFNPGIHIILIRLTEYTIYIYIIIIIIFNFKNRFMVGIHCVHLVMLFLSSF